MKSGVEFFEDLMKSVKFINKDECLIDPRTIYNEKKSLYWKEKIYETKTGLVPDSKLEMMVIEYVFNSKKPKKSDFLNRRTLINCLEENIKKDKFIHENDKRTLIKESQDIHNQLEEMFDAPVKTEKKVNKIFVENVDKIFAFQFSKNSFLSTKQIKNLLEESSMKLTCFKELNLGKYTKIIINIFDYNTAFEERLCYIKELNKTRKYEHNLFYTKLSLKIILFPFFIGYRTIDFFYSTGKLVSSIIDHSKMLGEPLANKILNNFLINNNYRVWRNYSSCENITTINIEFYIKMFFYIIEKFGYEIFKILGLYFKLENISNNSFQSNIEENDYFNEDKTEILKILRNINCNKFSVSDVKNLLNISYSCVKQDVDKLYEMSMNYGLGSKEIFQELKNIFHLLVSEFYKYSIVLQDSNPDCVLSIKNEIKKSIKKHMEKIRNCIKASENKTALSFFGDPEKRAINFMDTITMNNRELSDHISAKKFIEKTSKEIHEFIRKNKSTLQKKYENGIKLKEIIYKNYKENHINLKKFVVEKKIWEGENGENFLTELEKGVKSTLKNVYNIFIEFIEKDIWPSDKFIDETVDQAFQELYKENIADSQLEKIIKQFSKNDDKSEKLFTEIMSRHKIKFVKKKE